MVERPLNTDCSAHNGLLHSFARKAYGRLSEAGISADYEDIFQDMNETMIRAAKLWKPDFGVAFTTYAGRSIWNDFNRRAESLFRENEALKPVSIDEPIGEDGKSRLEVLELEMESVASPDEVFERKEQVRTSMQRLSQGALLVVREFMHPSDGLMAHHAELCEKAKQAKESGATTRLLVSERITFSVIVSYLGYSNDQIKKVRSEIKKVYGVKI